MHSIYTIYFGTTLVDYSASYYMAYFSSGSFTLSMVMIPIIPGPSFNFTAFQTKFGKVVPDTWLQWFIGFAEGDGSLGVWNKQLRFILTQKEGKILYDIQSIFGFGEVLYVAPGIYGNKYGFYRWIVTKPEDTYLLILLFNGNLVLPYRIQQLGVWLSTYNLRNTGVFIISLITTVVTITLNDAWLSGFTDAEGCFNVTIRKNRLYGLVI